MEPIITRIKERRMVELNGETFEVEETVTLDYGRQGKTTVYIRPPCGVGSREQLNRVLKPMGYRLAEG